MVWKQVYLRRSQHNLAMKANTETVGHKKRRDNAGACHRRLLVLSFGSLTLDQFGFIMMP